MSLPDRTLIMGIVNATPDSFSGDGVATEAAIEQGLTMLAQGADILDIGGESTRPDSQPVSMEEELSRVIPVIEGLRSKTDALISIDTMKAAVAEAAIKAGASIINDVTGGRGDPDMLGVMARTGVRVVLMHNRASWQKAHGGPAARSFDAPDYKDFMADMLTELDRKSVV